MTLILSVVSQSPNGSAGDPTVEFAIDVAASPPRTFKTSTCTSTPCFRCYTTCRPRGNRDAWAWR